MRKIFAMLLTIAFMAICFTGCSENEMAKLRFQREQKTAAFQSEFAKTVNKLEMSEGNFKNYRRVVFYNVRLGETVFSCEGYSHIRVDDDGDIEIVTKTDEDSYLRHYLKPGPDIIYFSEQLKPSKPGFHYKISFNPKLWIPETFLKTETD